MTNRLPYTFAKRHGVLLVEQKQDKATIAHQPNLDVMIIAELRRSLNCELTLVEVSNEEFQARLAKAYERNDHDTQQMVGELEGDLELSELIDELPKTEDLLESEDDAPIIRLINALFTQAIKQVASDIHIETFETHVQIRFRIDGVLQEVLRPQRVLAPLLVSRIKVMAKLDIAEKRLPQDGRIALKIAGRHVDVRVSTMPSAHGERVVMRLLDKQAAHLNLTNLGMSASSLTILQQIINQPHGILLVTGPTGSGKTTSLYACLTELNHPSRNILTVEDPIEYYLPGIGQTQVNAKIDMSFAKGLRAILRQDPDIVMLGEIRDLETAEISIQASLTGHLVLSTLHTNTAIGAITRLRDMGVESFLLSSSLVGLVAQRLVRVLCNNCKNAQTATQEERELLSHNAEIDIYHPVGCHSCNHTGYSGRTGVYEVLRVNEQLRNMIHNQASEQELKHYAHQQFASIQKDGLEKVKAGVTSLEELLRVLS